MKRKLLALFIGAVAIILPISVFAQDFRTNDNRVYIGSGETVDHNVYAFSGDVTVDGTVNGDLFVGGGQVTINGTVGQDLFVGGGTVNIKGKVSGDLRVAGGNVNISGTVGGELLSGAGTLNIEKDAVVNGEVSIGAGQATIAGTTGSILASVGTLTLDGTAKVNGNLTYTSKDDAIIQGGAVISGSTTHKLPPVQKSASQTFFSGKLLAFLITIIIAFLFLFIFPNKSTALASDWKNRYGMNLLWGFIALILVPIAAIILMVTVIGIPIGIGAFLLYPIYLYLGNIVGTIALGTWIKNWWEKEKSPTPSWLAVVIGAIVMAVLSYVPVIGWLAIFIVFLAGIGALIRFDWNLFIELRSKKTF